MEWIVALLGSLVASWVITSIWVAAGFLALAILRVCAERYLDFIEWIKKKSR